MPGLILGRRELSARCAVDIVTPLVKPIISWDAVVDGKTVVVRCKKCHLLVVFYSEIAVVDWNSFSGTHHVRRLRIERMTISGVDTAPLYSTILRRTRPDPHAISIEP